MQPNLLVLLRTKTIKCLLPYTLVISGLCPVPNAQAQDSPAAQESPTAQGVAEEVAAESSSSSSVEAPLYPNKIARDRTLIAEVAGEQAQWLDTEHGKILVFYRPTEARETRGVLVLFHSAEDPQAWPPVLENLRANLPRFGWETLAVTLPQKYPVVIPPRPSSSSASAATAETSEASEADNNQENPTTEAKTAEPTRAIEPTPPPEPKIPRDELVAAYVKAAFDFLNEKAQQNAIVLVDNSSADLVLGNLLPQINVNRENPDTLDGPMQALVITNLQSEEPLANAELAAIFANPKLPVLDVFFTPDSAEQQQARDLHRAVAMRQKLEIYQQANLESQPKIIEDDPRSFLAARVRGFMQRHADGLEKERETGGERESRAQ